MEYSEKLTSTFMSRDLLQTQILSTMIVLIHTLSSVIVKNYQTIDLNRELS